MPFTAIGGIKIHNIGEVMRHGARSCSVISEIVNYPDIAGQVEKLRKAMRGC
jgi:thiamine-phosphate pyrophosphorylase